MGPMMMKVILRRAFLAHGRRRRHRHGGQRARAGRDPAEDYVQGNIHKGLDILNNKQLSTEQRRVQFANFLLGLTDMKRIADFTLGQYRRTASPGRPGGVRGARSRITPSRSINPISPNMPARL